MKASELKRRPPNQFSREQPFVVAIVGGSGSGKSWLADRLARALAPRVVRVSLDDFYRDRSHLSMARRARLNFDHPRAIDWPLVARVLSALCRRQRAHVPRYDFATHARLADKKVLDPKPVILVDGLWLLRRPSIRKLFAFRLFLHCPSTVRFSRRLARDLRSRGRTRASVLHQFRQTVEPMHRRFVEPQIRYADLVLRRPCTTVRVENLARQLWRLAEVSSAGRRGNLVANLRPELYSDK